MEGSKIKACQIQARKVAQDILLSVWRKERMVLSKSSPEWTFVPEITEESIQNLCDMVWDEAARKERVWGDFLKKHFNRMVKAPQQFTAYVAYASYLSIEKSTNALACFLDILSLVIQFTTYCWSKLEGETKFLNMTIEVFCAFFDKELCGKFEEQGGWKNLSKLESVEDALSPTGEYAINGVVLKNITRSQVENNQRALSFANYARDKVKEVYQKKLVDVLNEFNETDRQLEKLSCEMVGVANYAGGEDHSLQKVPDEALKNISSLTSSDDIEDQAEVVEDSHPLETHDVGSSKSPNFVVDHIFKLENKQKAVALLGKMMDDIAKISELIKFVCEEN